MRWRWLAVVPMVLAGSLLGALPAYGHVTLIASDPLDGVSITVPLARAQLTFSEPLEAGLSRAALMINGVLVTSSEPSWFAEDTIHVPLPARAGRYRIIYRVVGVDGHRVDGQIRFTVTGPPGSTPTTALADEPSGYVEPSAWHTEGSSIRASRSSLWPLAGLGALLLLGALAYVLTIGRNRDKEASSSVGTTGQPHGDDSSGERASGDDHPRGSDAG